MPSVQRFLSGRDNLARSAALTASSVRASSAVERVAVSRAGGGRVRLAGDYVGHEATQVEVEIVAAGGIPRASVPQFVGVGNGQLQVDDVDAGAPLQGLTFTLSDLGVATAHAVLDVREVQLRARTPGDAGNLIRITVQPQLTRTATSWALLSAWNTGTAVKSGTQWDFGGLPLNAAQELDAASPRIQFGFDPQVYRPWRRFKDGEWQFGLSPALQRDVPAGTPVFSVTGGYKITVSDGVTTETFGDTVALQPAIVSFYDMLLALQASTLVEVAGVIAADRLSGGQAAIDVPLRTEAWLLAMSGKVALENVTVPAGAPTQSVTVRCINADVVGAESWSVSGDVSGALAVATTGVPYASEAVAFTVPRLDPAALGSGRWSFKYQPTGRSEAEGVPSVCLRPFRLGINAVARTVTFRYAKRPPADCKCSDMPTPQLSLACLGLFQGDAMALDPAYQSRLELLYQWRRDFTASNTTLPAPDADQEGGDLDLADRVTQVFAQALAEIVDSTAALAEWDDALSAMKTDMTDLEGTTGPYDDVREQSIDAIDVGSAAVVRQWNDLMLRRYAARMDYCRVLAGIVPKSDSSSSDAGGCWIDHPDAFWWVDEDGYYLPAFTNQAYISARRNTETGEPYSTQEFGFGLVVACPDRLRLGDTITVRIEAVDGQRPYSVGDVAVIQTIGAGAAWLSGGVTGTDEQTWRVTGTVSGALPDYTVPTDGAPAPVYSAAGVDLRILLGGIPFALGDTFTLAIEAGQYRWRRDGGAWSAVTDIPANGEAALADGLVAHFDAGAAPSFVPADAYGFKVHQPWAVSHVRDAQATAWGWAGTGATLVLDLGAVQALGAIALARYQLPAGATVTAELSDDGTSWAPPLALDTSRATCVRFLAAYARYVRLTVAGAAGGHIGWVWAGMPMATDHHASSCRRNRRWAAQRGDGYNAGSLYAGAGDGWSLGWSSSDATASRLLADDVTRLVSLLDWAQAADEPLLFVPHHLYPQDASLVRFAAEALEVGDEHEYQTNQATDRLLSAALELDPVYQ